MEGGMGRAGVIETSRGEIHTPAFIPVGTKATVKALLPEMVEELGAEAILANTFHLHLEPGEKVVEKAGGLGKFMNWKKPTFTDSGGFQVFSLGKAFGGGGKISDGELEKENGKERASSGRKTSGKQAKIDEEGVTFFSPLDGSERRMTPESSVEIQQKIGADIIFAFDECTLPSDSYEYQKEAMERTHRWAKLSLDFFEKNRGNASQELFGIVQGGRHEDLRKISAREIGSMDFDGFGIGGSFEKKDMGEAVRWVNEILPEEKPRHLLGIGEPRDMLLAVENGCDTFDCVAPTRLGRNGNLYTKEGRLNINNAKFKEDFAPIENECQCYTCRNFTRAYLSHLFRADEMLAGTLASIHNLFFLVTFVSQMREAILNDSWASFKEEFR